MSTRPVSPPDDLGRHVGDLVLELAGRLGEPAVVEIGVDLMGGASRHDHRDVLPYLTAHSWADGEALLDPGSWHDYWLRTWGARALLYVWGESATGPVVAGLADDHWRPAEMCLKVVTRREVGGAGDGAVLLSTHELPRVRAQAMRTLGAVGDTEHVVAVRDRLDDEHADVRRQAARALESLATRLDLP